MKKFYTRDENLQAMVSFLDFYNRVARYIRMVDMDNDQPFVEAHENNWKTVYESMVLNYPALRDACPQLFLDLDQLMFNLPTYNFTTGTHDGDFYTQAALIYNQCAKNIVNLCQALNIDLVMKNGKRIYLPIFTDIENV
jgi:hypothetical protein